MNVALNMNVMLSYTYVNYTLCIITGILHGR